MQTWTSEQVLSLAPDTASASAGQGLASARKWSGIGRSERAIWGLCQGSGKDPYQARVDLSEPAFKCSCPSRKFPCKHGLALMLLFVKDAAGFKVQQEPGWVAEWLAGRSDRAEKKAEKVQAAAEKPVDLEAQAKRAAKREANVADGIAACKTWLEDLIRRGLAAARSESVATWERTAARMVDAQAPGLAGFIRRIPDVLNSGEGWEGRALDSLGRLHLLLCAGERLADVGPELAADIRTALGWNQSREEVLAGRRVKDRWATLGQVVEEEDRLKVRRTYLLGLETASHAMVLDFAAGGQPLPPPLGVGSEFGGEVAFYPGGAPMRALVVSRDDTGPLRTDLGGSADASIEAGLARYAKALAANPWLLRWPLVITRASVVRSRRDWLLADLHDAALPLKPSFAESLQLWRLVSAGGDGPMTVLAEWDGEYAVPVSAMTGRLHHDVAPRWAA